MKADPNQGALWDPGRPPESSSARLERLCAEFDAAAPRMAANMIDWMRDREQHQREARRPDPRHHIPGGDPMWVELIHEVLRSTAEEWWDNQGSTFHPDLLRQLRERWGSGGFQSIDTFIHGFTQRPTVGVARSVMRAGQAVALAGWEWRQNGHDPQEVAWWPDVSTGPGETTGGVELWWPLTAGDNSSVTVSVPAGYVERFSEPDIDPRLHPGYVAGPFGAIRSMKLTRYVAGPLVSWVCDQSRAGGVHVCGHGVIDPGGLGASERVPGWGCVPCGFSHDPNLYERSKS